MKEIKILHLFPHLLSLYGEYGNLAILKKELENAGHVVTVSHWESGPLDLEQDLIYIGSGTEDNLLLAAQRLLPHAEEVKASMEKGTLWLATGNAMALFGAALTRSESVYEGLGLFQYQTLIDDSKRFLGDVVAESPLLSSPIIGYVNTSCIFEGIETPLMSLLLNKELGSNKKEAAEGILSGSFWGTQLIGPLLVKNPEILSFYFEKLTGSALALAEDSLICKAYEVSRRELAKRIG